MSLIRIMCNLVSQQRSVIAGSTIESCVQCGGGVWLSKETAIMVQEKLAENPGLTGPECICTVCAAKNGPIPWVPPSTGQLREIADHTNKHALECLEAFNASLKKNFGGG
jgi:hypothetical protein